MITITATMIITRQPTIPAETVPMIICPFLEFTNGFGSTEGVISVDKVVAVFAVDISASGVGVGVVIGTSGVVGGIVVNSSSG